MTAQIPDTYHYKGKKYSIIAMSAPIDFDPVEAAYVRVVITSNSSSNTKGAQIAEICIYEN